ncbi:alkaline phosphatase family protein [Candidatus Uabimicrobium amorphum]|uniref:Phosphodiesterase n=1 Tax=Uabimicrobium amorphum TaxID=2596890 RepID=A0A5S9ILH1_UABAM|nr:alkaline phosphatase family protein [Candidatus Uabimicrobium amorphum]BBM83904.1 phosphodiesterase [Candidatus Uabimicrobium amorphum]
MRYTVLIFIMMFVIVSEFFAKPRVIVLGFDGADPQLIEKWIEHLPNIQKLQQQGTLTSLTTTNPSHSPVAWATFATGNNPGKHRIFGFLKRSIGEYKPQYAVAKAEDTLFLTLWQKIMLGAVLVVVVYIILFIFLRRKKWGKLISLVIATSLGLLCFYISGYLIPQKIPRAVPLKQGTSFWTRTGENNIKTDVIMAPIAFPAEKVACGHLLCGFGVPDALGTNGTWVVYSSESRKVHSTETGGWYRPLVWKNNVYNGVLNGPKNLLAHEEYRELRKKEQDLRAKKNKDINLLSQVRNRISQVRQKLHLKLPMKARKISNNEVEIVIQNNKQVVKKGQWSEWFFLRFDMTLAISLHGAIRIYVSSLEEEVNLYVTPIQFSPRNLPPNVKLSHPRSFASEVEKRVGMYPTLGWASATNALKDEAISERAFQQDLQNILHSREKIFQHTLKQKQDLLVAVFYFTDRASHMYWRFIDEKHPLHEPNLEHKLLDVYKEMDRIIGIAHNKLNKNDILLVVSDHGFKSFRWQVNVNTWLQKNGYLFLKDDKERSNMQVRDLFERSRLLQDIDWKRTTAYAIGLGKIFINLQNREPQGVVNQDDYYKLREEIGRKLKSFTFRGEKVVNEVFMQEKVFIGPYSHEAADIVIGFADGYRVSWQTSLGGVPNTIVEPNKSKWSGDHCSVDPRLVPGVFMCNHKVSRQNIHLQDLAPTILGIFSVKGQSMDGKKFQILNEK